MLSSNGAPFSADLFIQWSAERSIFLGGIGYEKIWNCVTQGIWALVLVLLCFVAETNLYKIVSIFGCFFIGVIGQFIWSRTLVEWGNDKNKLSRELAVDLGAPFGEVLRFVLRQWYKFVGGLLFQVKQEVLVSKPLFFVWLKISWRAEYFYRLVILLRISLQS